MSETIFILGAGASKQAGAPLMETFLDTAHELKKNKNLGEASNDFDLVFKAIGALDPAHARAQIDAKNIESVFAAFEMAKLLSRLGSLTKEEVDRLPDAIRRVINITLEKTIFFPFGEGTQVLPPAPYAKFGQLVQDFAMAPNITYDKVSVITFNYDICVDYGLNFHGLPIDYGLEGESPSGLRLLKLHGSLNWGHCSGCNAIVPWSMNDFFNYFLKNHLLLPGRAKKINLEISLNLDSFSHCPNHRTSGPIVVPPTWNKTRYHEQLGIVWRSAATELGNVENIFVSGYSLPQTDQFFRYLYALGTIGFGRLKRYWVFDPEPSVKDRFLDHLGPIGKTRFEFYPKTFEEAIPFIRKELNIKSV